MLVCLVISEIQHCVIVDNNLALCFSEIQHSGIVDNTIGARMLGILSCL